MSVSEQNIRTCDECGKETDEWEECDNCGNILCPDCVEWDGELMDYALCRDCYDKQED